jgi:hypothetical protein
VRHRRRFVRLRHAIRSYRARSGTRHDNTGGECGGRSPPRDAGGGRRRCFEDAR